MSCYIKYNFLNTKINLQLTLSTTNYSFDRNYFIDIILKLINKYEQNCIHR